MIHYQSMYIVHKHQTSFFFFFFSSIGSEIFAFQRTIVGFRVQAKPSPRQANTSFMKNWRNTVSLTLFSHLLNKS